MLTTLSFFAEKSVYFLIDEVARDSIVAAGLKVELARDKIHLEYGNRRDSAILVAGGHLDAYDAYVVPSLDVFRSVFPDPGCIDRPIVILPTESIGGKHEHISRTAAKFLGAFPEENRPWFDKVSLFCIWGDNHRRVFTEYAPELAEKVFLVGHPRMDRRCLIRPSREAAKDQRKTVGFMTRFSTFNDFAGRPTFLQIFNGRKRYYVGEDKIPLRYLYDMDKDIEDILYKDIGDFRLMVDLIYYLAWRGIRAKVRVHPRENRLEWQRLIDELGLPAELSPWDEPFSRWLGSVDSVVSPASTGFYDCFVAGVRPICTNELLPYRKDHLFSGDVDTGEMLNHVYLPKSFEELAELVLSDAAEEADIAMSSELEQLLKFETGYPDCYRSHALLRDAVVSALATGSKRKSGKQTRAIFQAKSYLVNLALQLLRSQEQGSSFYLTSARKRWIDRLVDQANPTIS